MMSASSQYQDQPIQEIIQFMDHYQVSPISMKKVKFQKQTHTIRIEAPIKPILPINKQIMQISSNSIASEINSSTINLTQKSKGEFQ